MMKWGWVVAGILLLAAAPLIIMAGTVYTLMLPNIYQAQARIAVSETLPIVPFASGNRPMPAYNAAFLRTQLEIIQSKPVLEEVVNRLNLQDEWGTGGARLPREAALKILGNSIEVYQLRDTSLIVISCRRPAPDEAARIANELAVTYRDSRLAVEEHHMKQSLAAMEEALAEQQQRVNEAEIRVRTMRMDYDHAGPLDPLQVDQLQKDRLAAQKVMTEKETILGELNSVTQENAREIAGRVDPDDTVVVLLQQLQDVEAKLNNLSSNLGPNHPDVKRLNNQQLQCETVLMESLLAYRKRTATEYQIASDRNDAISRLLSDAGPPTDDVEAGDYAPFRKALADLENERFIYNQLNARIRQEILSLETPRNPVEIIDIAEPNRRPVSPNLFINVVVSLAFGLSIASTGAVMLVLGLRKARA